jgi:hypothetical protein
MPYSFLLPLVPCLKMLSEIILSMFAVSVVTSLIFLTHLYHSLSLKIHHSHFVGHLPPAVLSSPSESHPVEASSSTRSSIHSQLQSIQSLPPSFHTVPQNYHIYYDSCYKTVPASALGESLISNPSQLLTLLLRRNMALFATRLPQAWFLRFLISRKIPSLLPSFAPEHIRTLEFEPGDIVAGVYRVVVRTPTRVEFDMWVPPQSGVQLPPIEGRLIIGVDIGDWDRCKEGGREAVFQTLTLQWRLKEQNGVVLPLERSAFRFLHHLAAWWLLESGVTWLCGVGGQMKKEQ